MRSASGCAVGLGMGVALSVVGGLIWLISAADRGNQTAQQLLLLGGVLLVFVVMACVFYILMRGYEGVAARRMEINAKENERLLLLNQRQPRIEQNQYQAVAAYMKMLQQMMGMMGVQAPPFPGVSNIPQLPGATGQDHGYGAVYDADVFASLDQEASFDERNYGKTPDDRAWDVVGDLPDS